MNIKSWVEIDPNSDFSIQKIQFALYKLYRNIFRCNNHSPKGA